MKLALALIALVQLIASCVPPTPSAPPPAEMPTVYRGAASTQTSLANVQWRKLYDDPVLQGLIERALVKNFDVEIAYTAVLQAEANLGITAANQSVFVNGVLAAPYDATTGNKPPGTPSTQFTPQLGIGVSYQVDLFGKLASATGAARDQLLESQAATNTVLATVVADVATAYFRLRELDDVLAFTEHAVTVRRENVRLAKLRVEGGESSMQDLRQAEQSLYEVTENIPTIRQEMITTENALSVLTGDYPHDIARGLPLTQQVNMPVVPSTGVPSELLQRRPDVQASEYAIAAAAGNVDVARKLLYPSLTSGRNGRNRRAGRHRPIPQRDRSAIPTRRGKQRLLWPARALLGRRATAAADLQRRPNQVTDPSGASPTAANHRLVSEDRSPRLRGSLRRRHGL